MFGNKSGTKTLLVFTGNATLEILQTAMNDATAKDLIPDFVIDSVGDLLTSAQQLAIESKIHS